MFESDTLTPFSIRPVAVEQKTTAAIHKKKVEVLGQKIAYLELGIGTPVVFLHGNWCTSLLWRNIMPSLASRYRCIALDLPGFGDSDALAGHSLESDFLPAQQRYLHAFLERLGVTQQVTLVMFGMSTLIGCHWAYHNQERLRAIVHANGCFADASRLVGAEYIEQYRSEDMRAYIRQSESFFDELLPALVRNPLDPAALAEYRRTFSSENSRSESCFAWTASLPSFGRPLQSHEQAAMYSAWLRFSQMPKLRVRPNCDLDDLTKSYQLVADGFVNQQTVSIDSGWLIPEDNPESFSSVLKDWLDDLS